MLTSSSDDERRAGVERHPAIDDMFELIQPVRTGTDGKKSDGTDPMDNDEPQATRRRNSFLLGSTASMQSVAVVNGIHNGETHKNLP